MPHKFLLPLIIFILPTLACSLMSNTTVATPPPWDDIDSGGIIRLDAPPTIPPVKLEANTSNGTSPTPLPSLNDVSSNTITNSDPNCEVPTNWKTYTVQSGDFLSAIAGKYKTTSAKLIAANCLDNPSLLLVGQVLVVPDEVNN